MILFFTSLNKQIYVKAKILRIESSSKKPFIPKDATLYSPALFANDPRDFLMILKY